MNEVEDATIAMRRRKYERDVNKEVAAIKVQLMIELFSKEYDLKEGRQKPRNPDEKETLERWAKDGYGPGTI